MREIRPSGSEGGGNGTTRSSLPLSILCPCRALDRAPRQGPLRTPSAFGIPAYLNAYGALPPATLPAPFQGAFGSHPLAAFSVPGWSAACHRSAPWFQRLARGRTVGFR